MLWKSAFGSLNYKKGKNTLVFFTINFRLKHVILQNNDFPPLLVGIISVAYCWAITLIWPRCRSSRWKAPQLDKWAKLDRRSDNRQHFVTFVFFHYIFIADCWTFHPYCSESTNVLTNCVEIGDNGTIDGQGSVWWGWFHAHTLNFSRPHLVEIVGSNDIVISNLTFLNSPAWSIHPVYCRCV